MDIRRRFILLCLFLPVVVLSQSDPDSLAEVRFIVRADTMPAGDTIFIAGNHEILGYWHPATVSLKTAKNNSWTFVLNIKKGTGIKYKFTRGGWDSEAVYQRGQIPRDFELYVSADTTVLISILSWKDFQEEIKISGQVTGEVRYHQSIEAYGLKPRDVIVWLPPAYDEDLSVRYPVLYMHDGQNMFDPQTSAMGHDWMLDETADSLIVNGRIDPVIIVGIYNTPDRSREYLETDTGRLYMKLVVNIIKPLIDDTYRTKPGNEFTATGGSSAAGLLSFMLVWEYPDVFSRAACISPVFRYSSETDTINYIDNVIDDDTIRENFILYLENGDDELDRRLEPGILELVDALREKGYEQDNDFVWYRLTNSGHNEISWAKNSRRFLEYLFGQESAIEH